MNVALIEDEVKFRDSFYEIIGRYSREKNLPISLSHFFSAESFLSAYNHEYSLLFIDINLPGITGIECAKRLREKGDDVIIIFVTNFAKFAVNGYEVNAMDFILKPIIYQDFVLKLNRAVSVALNRTDEESIMVSDGTGFVRIKIRELMYIEVIKHYVYYHLIDRVVKVRGVFSEVEKSICRNNFLKCSKSYIVNADYITSVRGQSIFIGKDEIPISQSQRKVFMQRLVDIIGGTAQ